MTFKEQKPEPVTENRGIFHTTHWSVVWQAREPGSQEAADALEKLCSTYWPPLYGYIRREGYGVAEAQDLTQEFLSRFVHREWLGHLQEQRGKFRCFLLTFLKHFLSDERDRARAQKRGGGRIFVPLDAYEAEERDAMTPSNGLSADQIYDRRWAAAVMFQAAKKLEAEYARRGKAALFERLKDLQPNEHGAQSYAELGAALGMTEQAFKNAVHTFRHRYAEFLRREIAETVMDPSQVEEELRHLLELFAG
jgi:RNA polymerase sigma-70 factor (ECF subfamily)